MRLEISLPDDVRVVSTNEMYMPRPYRGGKGAYLTRSTALKKFQKKMEELLADSITDEQVSQLTDELSDDSIALFLDIQYGFDSSTFFREDTSNFIKSIEDCISRRLGIDDARNCKVHAEKTLTDKPGVSVVIETYKLDFEIPDDKEWKVLAVDKPKK